MQSDVLYVLDTNVLITARDGFYDFDMVPEFWAWLLHQADIGRVKVPSESLEEVLAGKDPRKTDKLYAWAHDKGNRTTLDMGEANIDHVQTVLEHGYSPNLTDVQSEALRADPFVIAHALADKAARCVVTHEHSKPTRAPHNRKIPDACNLLKVRWLSPEAFVRELKFSTAWDL